MAAGLYHAIIDFLCYGNSHFDLHQAKDAPSQELGTDHREFFHEWYQSFGDDWTPDDPFPESVANVVKHVGEKYGDDAAEESMAYAGHDVVDRTWDTLSNAQRTYLKAMFIWILRQQELLRDKFGLDVFKERIKRRINGEDTWERAPELCREYKRLLAYSKRVVESDPELQAYLNRYGSE